MADKPWAVPTATQIKDKWREVSDDMLAIRREFFLNSAFFHGEQWVRWDVEAATVNIIEFLSNQEGMARSTVNKLKPRMTSLLARLCQTPLEFQPRPEGIDSYAIQKARLAKQVLEVKAHRDQWAHTRRKLVRDVLLGGVAALATEPAFQYDDAPVIDPATGDKMRVPSRPAPKLSNLSAVEFGLEPGTVDESDALWWIRNTTLTPAQAKRRYKLDVLPTADSDTAEGPMQRALRSTRRSSTAARGCMVLVYYERPTDDTPGCVVHVLNDKVVQQGDWPFPFKELNVTVFTETEIGGTWKGDTRMNDARELQTQLNKAYTSINANLGRTDNTRLMVAEGSILDGEDEFTGTAGEVIRYNPEISGRGAYWLEAPQIPRWLREHIDNLESEMDDLFSTHAVSQGKQIGDRNSGLALSILAEKDETPLGLIAEDQQRGWQRVAEQVLMLERYLMEMVDAATMPEGQTENADPMRVTDVLISDSKGQVGEPKEVSWTAKDLPEHPVVFVPLDAVTPHSQAAVQDQMMKFAQAFPAMFAQFNPHQLGTILQVPDPGIFARVSDPNIEEAEWENSMMANGADEMVVKVQLWQPHAIHIKYHNDFRATAGYRDADPEIQKFIDIHVEAHEKLLVEQSNENMAYQASQQSGAAPQPPVGAAPGQPQAA